MRKIILLLSLVLFVTMSFAQEANVRVGGTTNSEEQNCEQARVNYLVRNPDVANANMDAWDHYTRYGKSEGRKWPKCTENDSEQNIKSQQKSYEITKVPDVVSNFVITSKSDSSFKGDKFININESYIDLKKTKPNTEICRCELARYLSLNLKQEQNMIYYKNNVHINRMQYFFKECYSKGFYDDFVGLTRDEVFKFGFISEYISPFKGNENKKISFKKISKIFSGETKYSTVKNSSTFIFNLREKETSSHSLQNQQNCTTAAENYLKNNPDVAKANMNAWDHYNRFGKSEGRKWPDCEDEDIKEYVFVNEDRYIGEYNSEGIINGNGIYKFKNGNGYNGQIKLGKFEGKGKLIYSNGDVYEGNWLDDKKNGIGKEIFSNGEIYEGNYENGLRQGKGIYKTSKLKYEGDWVNDLMEGYGMLISTEGYNYEGNFTKGKKEGKGVYKNSTGIYDGDWVNGLREGYGVLRLSNGNVYEGNWLNDKFNGNGKILGADGTYYIGNFENGARQGRGTYKDSSGIYDGDWINDVKEGYGKMTLNDHGVYEGYFKNNLFSGQGEAVLKDGVKYKGGFVEGLMDGYGKMTDKAGKVLHEGYWKNGEYIPESNPNDTVNIGNNSKSSSESTKNSTNINEIDFDIFGDSKKVLEEFSKNGVANQLSKSGTNINGERCKKCKIVLRTPKNRACYICNKRFSGWGFSKDSDGRYSKEQNKAIYYCHPFFGVHNYKTWSMSFDACCSRNCAMKL